MNKVQLLILLTSLAFSFNKAYSQCDPPASLSATYCSGQPATMEVTDPNTNVRYKWFNSSTDILGSYGIDGKGRNYISPNTQNGPADFYYIKETNTKIGPDYTTNIGGAAVLNDGVNPYSMPFDATIDFVLNTVTVIVRLDNATTDYGFNVRHIEGADTSYSTWYTAPRSAFTSLGSNFYRVDIPVENLEIKKGAGQFIEVISADDPGGTYAGADAFYWWGANQYNGASYANGNITLSDPEKDVNGTIRTPLIMDWDVTLQCDREMVTTVLSNTCCVPVGENFTVTSPVANPTNSNFPLTLTASGADINASMYYFWYDVEGNLLASGQGMNQHTVTQTGQYTVRVVNDPADISNFACYANRSILLNIRSIFAINDTTICIGDPLLLTAWGAEGNYQWSSTNAVAQAGIVTPDSSATNVRILQEGVYTFEVEGEVKLGNIAYDGKFENFKDSDNFDPLQPNLTFETTYGIAGGNNGQYITNNSQFRVDDEIRAWSPNNTFCNDPTYYQKTDPVTGDIVPRGNIFYADAHSTGTGAAGSAEFGRNNYLWQLSNQPVEPNTTYYFTMDVSEWNGSAPPHIMLLVNGQPLTNVTVDGNPVTLQGEGYYEFTGATCTWQTITATWNSGSNTSATITVAEVGKVSPGHEFAMDDITFFSGRGKQKDEVIVTVNNCFELEARTDDDICIGEPFPLSLVKNNGFLESWKDSKGNVVATTENAVVYPTANETYTATAKFPVINYLANGNFEGSKLDFTHGFTAPSGSSTENGNFIIGRGNESSLHTSVFQYNLGDHTSGSGKMMLARNGATANRVVLNKTISVTAGENYVFSAWLRNMHPHIYNGTFTNSGEFTFGLYLNNTLASSFTLGEVPDWENFAHVWTAATTGNVVVELRVSSTHNESGFALDDVSIAQLGMEKTDDVQVTVSICNTLTLNDEGCVGNERIITYTTDGIFTGWYDPDGNFISTADTLKVIPSGTETYSASASVGLGPVNTNGSMDLDLAGMQQLFAKAPQNASDGQPLRSPNYGFVTNTTDFTGGHYAAFGSASGSGKLLLVNSDPNQTNVTIYRSQPIPVEAGTDYKLDLSLAYALRAVDLAQYTLFYPIEVYVGTELIASIDLEQNNDWQNFSYLYSPATSGNVDIRFVLTRKASAPSYLNSMQFFAYAIDEVYLRPTVPVLSASIEVEPCFDCTPPTSLALHLAGKDSLSFCEGTNITLSASYNGTATNEYFFTWHKDGSPIGSPVNSYSDFGISPSTVADSGWYYLSIEDGASGLEKCIAYDSVFVNIDAPVDPGTIASNQDICEGDTPAAFTSTSPASGGNFTTYIYGWEYSDDAGTTWNTIAASTDTYSETSALTATRLYRRTASSGECPDDESNIVTVNVKPLPDDPAITVNPNQTAFCVGEAYTLTASSSVSSSASITYTWSDALTATGAIQNGLTTAGTHTYTVAVEADDCPAANTESITITVNPLPTAAITGGGAICNGDNATIEFALTGTAPWTISYTDPNGPQTITTSINPHSITTNTDGTYTLTQIEDDNGCTNTATGSVTVTTTPDLVVGPATATCDFPNQEFTVIFTVSGGTGAYTVTGENGGNISSGTFTSNPVSSTGPTSYTFRVSDASGCAANTNVPVTGTQNCACPIVASLTTPNFGICADETATDFTVDLSGGTAPYNIDITAPDGTILNFTNLTDGVNTVSISNLQNGTYSLSRAGDASCEGSVSGSTVLTINPLPTVTITGGTTICNGDFATLELQMTGTAPWTVNYTDPNGSQSINATTNPHFINTNVDGNYSLTDITDGNGCSNSASGTQTVSTTPDLVVGSATATCDFSTQEFTVVFNISDGDGNYTVTGENGGTESGGTFTSNPVSSTGPTNYIFSVSDGSGCPANTNVPVSGTQDCSCPVVGVLMPATESICADETSVDFTVDLSGALVLPYHIEITAPDGTKIPYTGLTDGINTITITNIQNGTYTLSQAGDADCNGSYSGSASIAVNPLPTATISGSNTICNDGISTTPVKITVTSGLAPFTVSYDVNNSGSAVSLPSGNGPDFTYNTGIIGTHTIASVTDANGCVSSPVNGHTGAAVITGDTPPDMANAGNDALICTGTYQLSAITPNIGTGAWTENVTGLTYDNRTSPSALVSGIQEGASVNFIWTVSNGVCPPSVDMVTVTRPAVTLPDAGLPQQICIGSTLTLNGNTPAATETGTWTSNTGSVNFVPSANSPSATVSGLPLGPHVFTWTISHTTAGCSKTDQVVVNVTDLPDNATAPVGPTVVCEGTQAQLFTTSAVGGATSYDWQVTSGDAVIRPSTGTTAIVDFGSVTSTIQVTAKNACGGGIPASVNVLISEDLAPSVDIAVTPGTICTGEEVVGIIADTIHAGVPQYNWYVNGVLVQTGGETLIRTLYQNSEIFVEMFTSEACVDSTVLNSNGAVVSAPVPVIVEAVPVADAGPDQYIIQGETVSLIASGGASYSWSPATNVVDGITTTQVLNVAPIDPVQYYYVTVSSESGNCSSTDSVKIIVEKPVRVWNSFSPNNDGIYDTWIIENLELFGNAKIEVFNRWGNLVWQSTGYNIPWDGTNFRNGQPLPVATYYYVIYPNGGKVKEPLTGHVTIVK